MIINAAPSLEEGKIQFFALNVAYFCINCHIGNWHIVVSLTLAH